MSLSLQKTDWGSQSWSTTKDTSTAMWLSCPPLPTMMTVLFTLWPGGRCRLAWGSPPPTHLSSYSTMTAIASGSESHTLACTSTRSRSRRRPLRMDNCMKVWNSIKDVNHRLKVECLGRIFLATRSSMGKISRDNLRGMICRVSTLNSGMTNSTISSGISSRRQNLSLSSSIRGPLLQELSWLDLELSEKN